MSRKLVTYIFLFIVFLLFLYIQRNFDKDLCEQRQESFNSDYFEGILLEPYIDSTNHMYQSLKIRTSTDTIYRALLPINPMRTLFSKVVIGDSIIKKKGDDSILLKRGHLIFKYDVKLNCID
ncbi:MAG: hypothetical protein ACXITV_05210 [Luteibaculaceae bacterium]